jgi:serine/threonine-protein kinase
MPQYVSPKKAMQVLGVLPVLTYLHDRQIIHRDISLDNIMLRDRDKMPVLIDFGVGKVATAQPVGVGCPYGTVVGKAGYSPIEQLKTGKVYPNSDLYALAVTAIALLTGKTPENLFDEMTVSWVWRNHAPDTDRELAAILDRMLSYRPQERYQSAAAVAAALNLIAPRSHPNRASQPAQIASSRPRRPDLYPRDQPAATPAYAPKLWQWGVLGTIAAIGAAIWMPKFHSPNPNEPIVSVTPSPLSIPTEDRFTAPFPPTSGEPLAVNPNGQPTEVSGHLATDRVRRYSILGTPERKLFLKVRSGKVRVQILHPDGQPPPGNPTISSVGDYFFPFAGKFLLDVRSTEATDFTLAIALMPNQEGIPRPKLDREIPPFPPQTQSPSMQPPQPHN